MSQDEAYSFPRHSALTRGFQLGVPRLIRVSPDGTRVLFVRSRSGVDPVGCLWLLEVGTGREHLLVDPNDLLGDTAELAEEERRRRERARERHAGVTTYATNREMTRIALALGGELFLVEITAETDGAAVRSIGAASPAFDPRLSGSGDRLSYVVEGRVRVCHLGDASASDHDRPLDIEAAAAVSGVPETATTSAEVRWGVAEFAAAEEMGRSRGHWWSPDGRRLLVARVDDHAVTRIHLGAPIDPRRVPEVLRYPFAGTPNSTVELWVFDLGDGSAPRQIHWQDEELDYLARVGWNSQGILLTAQPRDQRSYVVGSADPVPGESGPVKVIHLATVSDDRFVELVPGLPRRWAGKLVTSVESDGSRRLALDGVPVTEPGLEVRRVIGAGTDGLIFAASTDPKSVGIHQLSRDRTVQVVADEPGIFDASVGGDTLVLAHTGPDAPGTRTIVRADERPEAAISSLAEVPGIAITPEFAVIGPRSIEVAVLRPNGADPDEALPVLLDPYGGPHAQRVVARQLAHGTSQWFADQGYAVVVIDGRGTPARGTEWERSIHHDLAGPVLDDQIDTLLEVATEQPGLDLGRVGIRGWSFGGYLAALAVLRRPDVVHAAIAGAPVTSWRWYDTHYTERYLGHPDEAPEAYERTDLVAMAADLTRPLLLIHGLADDNVVAAHTLLLSQALLGAGCPHEVLPLSDITHMAADEVVAERLLLHQVDFLDRHLNPATQPR